MILWESVLIAVFGALLGLAVGIFFGWALLRAFAEQGFEAFHIPVLQLVIYVVVAGLAGVVAAVAPGWRAARVDVLQAVTTE
jgi:putative ABC transport system permease protein